MKRLSLILIVMILGSVALSACSTASAAHKEIPMAPASGLPKEMQMAPSTVREAYQFAVANPDALKNVPCYCGCGSIGHTSNLSCYVKDMGKDGTITFDNHALGCSLCVDIAQDVMKMSRDGKSPGEIHQSILAAFSQYGPANQ